MAPIDPPDTQAVAAYVDALSAALGIPIDPAFRAAVVDQVRDLLGVAGVLMEFDLPPTLEASPVFEP
jgi:hypothetical protein